MTPTFIGYFPKRTEKRPEWLTAAGVEEISSTSDCISKGPEDWIKHWRHNEMWVFDTAELAISIVPEKEVQEFEIYAYKMFPVTFSEGKQKPFNIPKLEVRPLTPSFEFLGFDIVVYNYNTFGCSPLSCNHMANHTKVNRYCLVDGREQAFLLAAQFEKGGCEPGPYHIVEVWRMKPLAKQETKSSSAE